MMPMPQYKSARAEADHLAALLRAALTRAGLPDADVSRVRGLVTGSGRAYVEVGALRITTALTLLDALPPARDTAPNPDDGPRRPAESF